MKLFKFLSKIISVFVLMLFAVAAIAQAPQTTYDFTQDSLNGVDSIYFEHPQALPDRTQTSQAYRVHESWQIQLINTPDTATATAFLEVSNFPNQDSWVATGDTVAIVGASSGIINTTNVNYKHRRVKLKQTNTATSFGDCAVRTVIEKE